MDVSERLLFSHSVYSQRQSCFTFFAEFAGYKQKKTARKAKTLSPLDIMRPAVPVLTAAILFGIGLFKVPLEPLPIEVTVAAVTLLTVCLLAYSSMIDVGWPVIAAVLVMFVVVLVTSMKLHSVMNSQKTNEIPGVSDDDPIVTDDVQTSLTEPPSEVSDPHQSRSLSKCSHFALCSGNTARD